MNKKNEDLYQENKNAIVNMWRLYSLKMTVQEQQRVKDKVLAGTDFDQAIKEEGIILFRHTYNLEYVREMFQNGELKISQNVVKVASAEPVTTEDVVRAQKEGFIPRPKNNETKA